MQPVDEHGCPRCRGSAGRMMLAGQDLPFAEQPFRSLFLGATYCEARVDHRVVSQAVVVATGVAPSSPSPLP